MGLTSEQERRLDSDTSRTRCTHCISPARRVRLDDEADRATASLSTQYTRYGALHPMRGATPDQKRCNAHGSGAAPNATSIFSDAHYPPNSASAHLPPSPWTATHYGP